MFNSFLESTTIHGAARIAAADAALTPTQNRVRRCLWLLVIFSSSSFMIFQIFVAVVQYLDGPVATRISEREELLPLPSIGFDRLFLIKKEFFESACEDHAGAARRVCEKYIVSNFTEDESVFSNFCQEVVKLNNDSFFLDAEDIFEDFGPNSWEKRVDAIIFNGDGALLATSTKPALRFRLKEFAWRCVFPIMCQTLMATVYNIKDSNDDLFFVLDSSVGIDLSYDHYATKTFIKNCSHDWPEWTRRYAKMDDSYSVSRCMAIVKAAKCLKGWSMKDCEKVLRQCKPSCEHSGWQGLSVINSKHHKHNKRLFEREFGKIGEVQPTKDNVYEGEEELEKRQDAEEAFLENDVDGETVWNLSVRYRNLIHQRYEEVFMITFYQLIGTVGGHLGLWMGMSIIGLMEIVEFSLLAFRVALERLRKIWHNRSSPA